MRRACVMPRPASSAAGAPRRWWPEWAARQAGAPRAPVARGAPEDDEDDEDCCAIFAFAMSDER